MAALILLGGCASLKDKLCHPGNYKLAETVNQLEKGNETAATKQLEDISNSKDTVDGTTDEALFRLSLLEIRKHDDPGTMQSIQKRLAKLQTNFPSSQWSRMSWPLTEYITQMESIKTDLRNLKQKNSALSKENRELSQSNQQLQGTVQSLTKENRDINQRIEKLKSLDIELEKKNRR
jgi:DNA repair ATPase RecN